jgi:hypothetical protein
MAAGECVHSFGENMTNHFTSPLFGYLGQRYDAVDFYASLFQSAEPKVTGEFPYLYANHAGIQFALTKKTFLVSAIFLFAEGVEGNAQYQGELQAGLSFASTRADVRAVLGEPAMGGDAGGEGIMAIAHAFDRYENEAHYLRVEHFDGAGVRLITLGSV